MTSFPDIFKPGAGPTGKVLSPEFSLLAAYKPGAVEPKRAEYLWAAVCLNAEHPDAGKVHTTYAASYREAQDKLSAHISGWNTRALRGNEAVQLPLGNFTFIGK